MAWREGVKACGRAVRRGACAVLDFLLPPLCLRCDRAVAGDKTLCPECWKALRFVAPPYCARCGAPFDLPVEEGTLCGACHEKKPAYETARAAFLYDDESKPLLLRFKHSDQLHGLPLFAQWLAQAGGSLCDKADCLVPVPLHRGRLLARRYNQSALLARALGAALGKPVLVDALIRTRATESQGHLSRKERAENVARAFALRGGADVAGKRVLLIDDVMTSGATVSECARILRKGGAARVDVLTLARVRAAT